MSCIVLPSCFSCVQFPMLENVVPVGFNLATLKKPVSSGFPDLVLSRVTMLFTRLLSILGKSALVKLFELAAVTLAVVVYAPYLQDSWLNVSRACHRRDSQPFPDHVPSCLQVAMSTSATRLPEPRRPGLRPSKPRSRSLESAMQCTSLHTERAMRGG